MTGGDIEGYLIKHARDRAFELRIAHEAMSAIGADVMRGLGVTRRRGAEVGGLLLGSFDRDTLVIEEVETIPCEYAYGPSWLLSDADSAGLTEAIARWRSTRGTGRSVVGWFRSHTREGLQPDAPDTGILHTHFGTGPTAFLLIKPYATRDSEAAVYLAADGRMDAEPVVGFTFGASPHVEVRHAHPPESQAAHRRHVPGPVSAQPPSYLRPPVEPPPPPPVRTADDGPRLPGRTLFHRANVEPPAPEPYARTSGIPVEVPAPPATPSGQAHPPARESLSVTVPEPLPLREPLQPAAVQPGPLSTPEPKPVVLPKVITEKERILQNVLGTREEETPASPRFGAAYRDLFADYGGKPASGAARAASWLAFALAAVLFGGIVGYRAAGGNVAALLDAAPASRPSNAYALGLTTGLRGDSILIRWDRRSEAVQAGLRGNLVITSPAGNQEIRLQPDELRNGVVLYKTSATEAEIRLEVFLTPSRLIAEQSVWKRQAFVAE